MPAFLVSQLKAWYGDDATRSNSFAYDYLPKIIGDHSHIPMFVEMNKGNTEGFFAMGRTPPSAGRTRRFSGKRWQS